MGNEPQYKEGMIRSWFDMWLQKNDAEIGSLFTHNATYIESWGPEYHGLEKIRHWFSEWNRGSSMIPTKALCSGLSSAQCRADPNRGLTVYRSLYGIKT